MKTASMLEGASSPMRSPAKRRAQACVSGHRPLTICGVDRRLFFLAMVLDAATFNLFYSLLAGLLMFVGLCTFALWVSGIDLSPCPNVCERLSRCSATIYGQHLVGDARHALASAASTEPLPSDEVANTHRSSTVPCSSRDRLELPDHRRHPRW